MLVYGGDTDVCNGPFKITEMNMGESMVLEKNENYWDAEDVTLDKLTFRYVLDTSTALTAYEGGEVDGVQSIPSSDYARLKAEDAELRQHFQDFQKEYGETLGLSKAVSLKDAVMYAGVDFSGKEHDALDDAKNTAALLRIVRIPELCKMALENVIDAFNPKPIGTSLGDLVHFDELGIPA